MLLVFEVGTGLGVGGKVLRDFLGGDVFFQFDVLLEFLEQVVHVRAAGFPPQIIDLGRIF